MSSRIPSIEEQLAQYRRRKQQQVEEEGTNLRRTDEVVTAATTTAASTHPLAPLAALATVLAPLATALAPLAAAVAALSVKGAGVVCVLLSPLGEFCCRVAAALFVLVAPEHLLESNNNNIDRDNNYDAAGTERGLRGENAALRDRLHMEQGHPGDASPSATSLGDIALDSDGDTDDVELLSTGTLLAHVLSRRSRWQWAALLLKVFFWFLLWEVFILWQFGAVYFLATGFMLIWINLRTGPRRPGEVSAYSVFNRDLRRIHGTVTAEQLQREMLVL